MRNNVLTWLLLVTLTCVGMFTMHFHFTIVLIGIFTFIKIICVGFQFMELRHAHKFWLSSLSVLIAILIILIFTIYIP